MSAVVRQSSSGRRRLRRALFGLVAAAAVGAGTAPAAGADDFNPATGSFTNPGNILIPGAGTSGNANPYPSTITAAGLYGNVQKVTVTLQSLTHTFPDDIDVLLVGPGGQRTILMSDAGGSANVNNVSLTFDDAAPTFLPDPPQIVSGTFRPSNFGAATDTFPAPAPGAPYGSTLAAFNGSNPNGQWRLFIRDDAGGDVGNLVGWRLNITATPVAGACANSFTLTNNPDTFEGGTGGDSVTALAGNDVLRGDGNRDCLSGNSGKDKVNGGSDRDRLRGNSGNDRLNGDSNNDRVAGDSGNDRASGGSGNDRVSGNAGRDRVSGNSGRDRVSGGSGNDRVSGGSGRDRIAGNSGNDRIGARDGRRDRVSCGSGRDFVRADSVDLISSNCESVSK